jgi:transcription antitermination factor NusG
MTARWYIVHAYSNFEKKVADSIEEQASQKGLSHLFEKILVPVEKVVEVRRGRKVDAERKFFPGYVMVRADLTDEAFHLIKNTPKVTGFLGSDSKPVPIPDSEAERILTRFRKASSVPSRRSLSRSANRCGCPMVRSPRSTARCRKSTRSARASRSRFPSSAGRPRSSSNTVRSRRSDASLPARMFRVENAYGFLRCRSFR